MNSSPTIIVTDYKNDLLAEEKLSLRNLAQILGHFPIKVVLPNSVEGTQHLKALAEASNVEIEYFPSENFQSLKAYNAMLRSTWFFERFDNFTHILVHHTDAFVFKDELLAWCEKDYGFIGAPLFFQENNKVTQKFCGLGNGGFGLYNVSKVLKVLSSNKKVVDLSFEWQELKDYSLKGKVAKIPRLLNNVLGINARANNACKAYHINEDFWYGTLIPKKFDFFTVPNVEQATLFSQEYNAEYLKTTYQLQNLPFGCHGWWKPALKKYWVPIIKNHLSQ